MPRPDPYPTQRPNPPDPYRPVLSQRIGREERLHPFSVNAEVAREGRRMTVTRLPQCGRRYSTAMMRRARELRAGEWQLHRVADFLEAEFGQRPSIQTISTWTREGEAERLRVKELARYHDRYAADDGLFHHVRTAKWKLNRMILLSEAGVSSAGIATVINVDFGHDFSEGQIRHAVELRRFPRERKAAA